MKSTSVIFAFTPNEVDWAVQYKRKHFREIVYILAPAISAQEILHNSNISAFDFFAFYSKYPDYYPKNVHDLMKRSKKILTNYCDAVSSITLLGSPVVDNLVSLLEIEFMYALFCYDYLLFVNNLWNPDRYYISSDITPTLVGGINQTKFVLADLASRFFLPKNKVSYYTVQKTKNNSVYLNWIKKTSLLMQVAFEYYKLLPKKIGNRFKTSPGNKSGFLLHSSGMNLYYYHDTLSLLLKNGEGTIVTGEQSAKEEGLLLESGIFFEKLKWVERQLNPQIIKKSQIIVVKQFTKKIEALKKLSTENSLERCLVDVFARTLNKHLNKTVVRMLVADAAIKHYNPSLVITTHDPGQSAVPFVQAAKRYHKKSLLLLHGWHDVAIGNNYYSDYAAVWGVKTLNWYHERYGKSKKKLFAVGFPFFDKYFSENLSNFWQRRMPRIPDNPIIGILVTLYWPDTFPLGKFFSELFAEAAKRKFSGRFMIRTHAHQELSGLRALSRKYSQIITVSPQTNLEMFIKNCDVIMCWDTTAIYYPMIFGKPLFYTTPLWGSGYLPIKKYHAAFVPKNAANFFDLLQIIISKPESVNALKKGQLKYLRDLVGVIDGTSSLKLTDLIRKLMTNP